MWAKKMEQSMGFISENENQRHGRNMKENQRQLSDRQIAVEFHQRKYSLLIFGLKMEGDCEKRVRDFFPRRSESKRC